MRLFLKATWLKVTISAREPVAAVNQVIYDRTALTLVHQT